MLRAMLAVLALGFALTSTANAASCRDGKGKFVKCHAAPAKKCRDAKGKFIKCVLPPAKSP